MAGDVVFVVSPFAGLTGSPEERTRNLALARQYCRELALAGHAPVAPHLYLSQFLDDAVPAERELGIRLGRLWMQRCDWAQARGDWHTSAGCNGDLETLALLGIRVSLRY